MNDYSKIERSIPVQTRVDLNTLAELDLFWTNEGYNIRSMSQLVSWTIEMCKDIIVNNQKMPQIFDSLVYLDLDGNICPGLAIKWQRLSDTRWEFELRKGVYFHSGEEFDSKAVKFTYDYALNPSNHAGNAWILSSIEKVEIDPDNRYRVW